MTPPPDESSPPPGTPARSLVSAPPPPAPEHADPARLASYVRAAMHNDRTPGELVVVLHPRRRERVPRGLFEAIAQAGWGVHIVETEAERVRSVDQIRAKLTELIGAGRPVDMLVIAGDGTLDHHVLIAAFSACYPDLVRRRDGEISATPLSRDELAALPRGYARALFEPALDLSGLRPDDATIKKIWRLQLDIDGDVRKGAPPSRLTERTGRSLTDPLLRLAVWAAAAPHRVVLRADGYDLEGLAEATKEETFQGLFPYIRSVVMYPAGTASDNALFSGVPGWPYAQLGPFLARHPWLDPLRRLWERLARRRFLAMFTGDSVVVPARFSLVRFDGSWQAVCSHAVGGPGSGHLFAADLDGKSHGLWGYLVLVPRLILREGVFGSTLLHVKVLDTLGRVKARIDSQLAEAMYSNRTFIGGLGTIPSTEPTSFAGRSSFVVAPPILARGPDGARVVQLSGLLTVFEAATKGVLARLLHLIGLDPGRLAGGGKLGSVWPDNQTTLVEGEGVLLSFHHGDGRPKSVPVQVSGDPYVAQELEVRVAWGPLPLLASARSQLLASARRTLAHLRVREAYDLDGVTIGGLYYYRHDRGARWGRAFSARTGLVQPPLHLRGTLAQIQTFLLDRWQLLDTGSFVDTSRPGFQLGRKGRYAHNADQTAHLVVLRQEHGMLLVRQVRAHPDGTLYEALARYTELGGVWIIQSTETRAETGGGPPVILQESHFSRSAEALEREAPAFFPVLPSAPKDD